MISKLTIFMLMILLVIIQIIIADNLGSVTNSEYKHVYCPQRHLKLRKGGVKYYYIGAHFKINWYQALLFCRRHGMELAAISCKKESDKIGKLLTRLGFGKERFWTSGTDLGEDGKYHWAAYGDLIRYTNWALGQPENEIVNDEVEHCVELIGNVDGTHFFWNDATCSTPKYFICEV